MELPMFFVVGATGTGKSKIALRIAQRLQTHDASVCCNPFIINCDVMQMFERGVLDTATNKMSPAEMECVPHLFMNFLLPTLGTPSPGAPPATYLAKMVGAAFEDVPWKCCPSSSLLSEQAPTLWSDMFDAWAQTGGDAVCSTVDGGSQYRSTYFVRDAQSVVSFLDTVGGVWSGKIPPTGSPLEAFKDRLCCSNCRALSTFSFPAVVCGGTHYYAQSLLGAEEIVEEGIGLKRERDMETTTDPLPEDPMLLWELLRSKDPGAAATFHPNDERRVRRRLEILQEGVVFGDAVPTFRFQQEGRIPRRMSVVWVDFDDLLALKARHDMRLEEMMAKGLVKEAREFYERFGQWRGEGRSPSIYSAIGYQELAPFNFDNLNEKTSLQSMKDHTHNYAVQQRRWVRNRLIPRFHPICAQTLQGEVTRGSCWRVVMDRVLSQPVAEDALQAVVAAILADALGTKSALNLPARCLEGCEDGQKIASETQPFAPYHCTVCDKLLVGGHAIVLAHMSSKAHRGALSHARLVKEQLEKYGRAIPPRKSKQLPP